MMDYIVISGFGWSGSGAVVDIVKEFKSCYEPDTECRLIKDESGLMALRYAIVEHRDSLFVDLAIKNFICFMDHSIRPSSNARMFTGTNLQKYYGNHVKDALNKFLENIIDFTYKGHWGHLEYKMTKKQLFKLKLLRRIGSEKYLSDMYFSTISGEMFDKYAKEFIDDIFGVIAKRESVSHIILDQAIPAHLPEIASHYLSNYKMIVVDRDPRDECADLIKNKGLIGPDIEKTKDYRKFAKWYKGSRTEKKIRSNNVMYIDFEDIVMNYNESLAKIMDFLGFSKKEHIHKGEFFDPAVSKNNIGIWKDFDKNLMEGIRHELEDYYQFKM